jgi:type II secretion system protein N
MAKRKSKHKKYVGYILFSILLTAALLYYRFPSEALKTYVQRTAEEMSPHYQVYIEDAQVAFPLGIHLSTTTVAAKDRPGTRLFIADTLSIRPEIVSLLRGKSAYAFDGVAYSGDLKGTVRFENRSTAAPFTTTMALSDIHMADYDYLSTLIGRNVKGILDGTLTYKGQKDLLMNGTGEADLKISNGWVQLLEPIFGLEAFRFDTLRIRMLLEKQRINLTNVELEGPELKGTLSGTISLRKDFAGSRLSLRGSIEPLEGMFRGEKEGTDAMKLLKRGLRRGKISFVIRGTPGDPRIRFI